MKRNAEDDAVDAGDRLVIRLKRPRRRKPRAEESECVAELLTGDITRSLCVLGSRVDEVRAATALLDDIVAIVFEYEDGATHAESVGAFPNVQAIKPVGQVIDEMLAVGHRRLAGGQVAAALEWFRAGQAACRKNGLRDAAMRFLAGIECAQLSEAAMAGELHLQYVSHGYGGAAEHLFRKKKEHVQLFLEFHEHAYRLGEEANDAEVCILALHNKGNAFADLGDLDEALKLWQLAIEARIKRDGPEHPGIPITQSSMAIALAEQGKENEAFKMYERVEARLGADNRLLAWTLRCMAHTYNGLGNHDAALRVYGRLLEIREARFGAIHPRVAATLTDIAHVLRTQRKYDAALKMYGRVLEILEQFDPADHSAAWSTLNHMADVYEQHGKHDEAAAMRARAIGIWERDRAERENDDDAE